MSDSATSARRGHSEKRTSIGPRRSPQSEAAILEAAEAILNENGHAAFTIEAVARRAGAGKPTIYRWWGSRTALLLDVYRQRKLEVPDPDTGSLEGDLVAIIRRVYRFWRDTPAGAVFRSVIVAAQSEPEALGPLTEYARDRRENITGVVERARARGEVSDDANPAAFADLFVGYLWGRLLTNRIDDDPDEIARAAATMMRGLATPRTAEPRSR
jgi:AcrR family transcriptional regulator